MNKKPRWRDKIGNLFTDREVVRTTDGKVFLRINARPGFPASPTEVFPIVKKR